MVLVGYLVDVTRRLPKICGSYAVAHRLRYNVKKSEKNYMFEVVTKSYPIVLNMTLYGVPLNVVTKFKTWVTGLQTT